MHAIIIIVRAISGMIEVYLKMDPAQTARYRQVNCADRLALIESRLASQSSMPYSWAFIQFDWRDSPYFVSVDSKTVRDATDGRDRTMFHIPPPKSVTSEWAGHYEEFGLWISDSPQTRARYLLAYRPTDNMAFRVVLPQRGTRWTISKLWCTQLRHQDRGELKAGVHPYHVAANDYHIAVLSPGNTSSIMHAL